TDFERTSLALFVPFRKGERLPLPYRYSTFHRREPPEDSQPEQSAAESSEQRCYSSRAWYQHSREECSPVPPSPEPRRGHDHRHSWGTPDRRTHARTHPSAYPACIAAVRDRVGYPCRSHTEHR